MARKCSARAPRTTSAKMPIAMPETVSVVRQGWRARSRSIDDERPRMGHRSCGREGDAARASRPMLHAFDARDRVVRRRANGARRAPGSAGGPMLRSRLAVILAILLSGCAAVANLEGKNPEGRHNP